MFYLVFVICGQRYIMISREAHSENSLLWNNNSGKQKPNAFRACSIRKQTSIFVWNSTEKCVRGNTLLRNQFAALQARICAECCHVKRINQSNMEIQRYNRLKIVLAEKERTGTWLSEQMGHNICTVSRWMTNKVEPTCGKFDLVARLSENSTRLLVTSMWMWRNY